MLLTTPALLVSASAEVSALPPPPGGDSHAYHRRARPHLPKVQLPRRLALLRRFLEGEADGFNAGPNQSVANYLTAWLAAKALVLKPTTMARYRDYVHNDLVPAFGTLKLDELGHRHIAAFVTSELAAGRGQTTPYRCLATLSSALGDAFRQHRLAHNPASPPALHRPPSPPSGRPGHGRPVRVPHRHRHA
ncbi:hypothetical protein [Streptomyces sp. NBC_00091]|uniref:hypothetical protein n=1 Tax=Streptomyces sp. NBC_00091 TaxID=2975648 RepID=UPI00225B1177|nr:hypothetical protein [Streptomyces sp. NBC_00091]MCX5381470.1 N-terminal phage integrase SAM-like domain-containing protein [Streptomyces sp. NBC_00091]